MSDFVRMVIGNIGRRLVEFEGEPSTNEIFIAKVRAAWDQDALERVWLQRTRRRLAQWRAKLGLEPAAALGFVTPRLH